MAVWKSLQKISPPRGVELLVASAIAISILGVILLSTSPDVTKRFESPHVPEPTVDLPTREPFTIAATGDILIHQAVADRAAQDGQMSGRPYDFRPMFSRIRPFIESADLAICHLETPLSWTNDEITSYPLFNAPRQVGQALVRTGFDACSTASNHSLDQGFEGIQSTLRVMDHFGIHHAGTTESRRLSDIARIDINGNAISLLSYTYGTNGIDLPTGKEWSVNLIKPTRILKDVGREEDAGADFIVVSLHWGLEYQSELTAEQLSLARRLARDGTADLVLGHHAHVVQPIRRMRDTYVVFGLGNILSNQRLGATPTCCPAATQDGMIAEVEVRVEEGELQATEVRYRPTWVDPTGFQIVPIAEELQSGKRFPEQDLRDSWKRTISVLRHSSGEVRPATRPP
ncbi:MAG: CapA family protein [Actinomycetota bacterium]|nr:CapA family protein [Actinomycetota bacterium]